MQHRSGRLVASLRQATCIGDDLVHRLVEVELAVNARFVPLGY
jgi:hypothetical protein